MDRQMKSLADGRPRGEMDANPDWILAQDAAKRAGLSLLVTPDEYHEIELRVSWTADNLRRAMTRFEPSEEEFRFIFQVWRAHDEQLSFLRAVDQPDPGNHHVFEAIQEFLGPERYARYRETWWR